MNYKGKLYGKVGGGYFPLEVTSDDYDKLLAETNQLRKIQDQLLSKIRELEDTVKYGFSIGTPLQHNKSVIETLESENKKLLSQRNELLEALGWALSELRPSWEIQEWTSDND